jgi:hypothetical protein
VLPSAAVGSVSPAAVPWAGQFYLARAEEVAVSRWTRCSQHVVLDSPPRWFTGNRRSEAVPLGAVAQVVERLLCKQQVRGSSPRSSTRGTHVCEVRLPQKRDEVGRFEGKSRSECGEELSEGVGRSASLTSSSLT